MDSYPALSRMWSTICADDPRATYHQAMKYFLGLLLLTIGGTALAGRDSGTIYNWNQYARQLQDAEITGGFGPLGTESEFNILRASFGQGRFSVTFDDNLAARLAQQSPNRQACPQVQRTQDLRTTLITGIIVKGDTLLRLTREGQSGDYKVTDAWVYATKNGTIKGNCTSGNSTASYNLTLRAGWNVIRIYNNDSKLTSVVQNITGRVIAWQVR